MPRNWFNPISKKLDEPAPVNLSRETELETKKSQLTKSIGELQVEKDQVEKSREIRDIKSISAKYNVVLEHSSFSYRMCREILSLKIQKKIERLDAERSEIEDELQLINWNQKMRSICPQCKGKGQVVNTEYFREDGQIISRTTTIECSLCKGTGKLT